MELEKSFTSTKNASVVPCGSLELNGFLSNFCFDDFSNVYCISEERAYELVQHQRGSIFKSISCLVNTYRKEAFYIAKTVFCVQSISLTDQELHLSLKKKHQSRFFSLYRCFSIFYIDVQ